jgi:hypothetical protein
MLVEPGTKVLVVHRRLFEKDAPRFFVGTVDAYENGVARISGTTWTRNGLGIYVRKPQGCTKIISISSGTVIVYQLPLEADIAAMEVKVDPDQRTWLTDGRTFRMDLTEHPA